MHFAVFTLSADNYDDTSVGIKTSAASGHYTVIARLVHCSQWVHCDIW